MVAISPWGNKKQTDIELGEATIAELALWHINNYLERNPHARSIETYSYAQQKNALNFRHKDIPLSIIQVQNYIRYIAECEYEHYPASDALLQAIKICIPQTVLDFSKTALPCVLLTTLHSADPTLLFDNCNHWHPWVREIASTNTYCPPEGKILANLIG